MAPREPVKLKTVVGATHEKIGTVTRVGVQLKGNIRHSVEAGTPHEFDLMANNFDAHGSGFGAAVRSLAAFKGGRLDPKTAETVAANLRKRGFL